MSGLSRFDFYPRDWHLDTRGLSQAAKGVYIDFLSAMYAHGGALPYSETDLCGVCGCRTVRSLRPLLKELIKKDKLHVVDGHLVNNRAAEEIDKAHIANGYWSKGGKARSRETRELFGTADPKLAPAAPSSIPSLDDLARGVVMAGEPLTENRLIAAAVNAGLNVSRVEIRAACAAISPPVMGRPKSPKKSPKVGVRAEYELNTTGTPLVTKGEIVENQEDSLRSPSPSPLRISIKEYRFEGKIVHLTAGDFATWEGRYSTIPDLGAELAGLDDWYASLCAEGKADPAKWWHAIQGALNKKHQRLVAERGQGSTSSRADDVLAETDRLYRQMGVT